MEDETPSIKRRRTENLDDFSTDGRITKQWSGNVEINTLSVKPDKFQKLRRIATNCTEKIQQPRSDDVIISSVGSSPSSSPRPNNLAAISKPVDPVELYSRLKVLVQEDDKENRKEKSGDCIVQVVKVEEMKKSTVVPDKNMNIPIKTEEFYALLRKLVNEKIKKLEEAYTETIIPSLEKKITNLENENKYLQEHAKQLEGVVKNILEESQKQAEKPVQCHVGVQAGFSEPPPLTPVTTTSQAATKPAPVVHIDDVPGFYKPPSSTPPQTTPVITTAVSGGYALQAVTIANGIRHTAALNNTGHVFTTSTGQPRMYSDATYKPGSHPNAVVTPRAQTNFARQTGPITATVYPQPQNLPTSSSTLRGSPPRNQSPPARYPYSPQTLNGVMIRGHAQPRPASQYVATTERMNNSTTISLPRQKTIQGPPPSYSVAMARPQQQQVSYHSGSTPNPNQTSVHHYAVRQGTPSGIAPPSSSHPRPTGPPPLVCAQPNMLQRPQTSPRYQAPSHVIHQRPSYSQNIPDPNRSQPVRHQVPAPASAASPSQNGTAIPRDLPPPTPTVSISGASNGIVLSWNMTIPEGCAPIDSYQLFAYQNSGHMANTPSLWKKLGIVKALPLPMACTLTQFVSGSMYYFAVRAIDIHGRAGTYSAPCAITLPNENDKGRA